MRFLLVLLCALAAAQTTIYTPSAGHYLRRINSISTSTITTADEWGVTAAHGLSTGDVVLVGNVVVNSGGYIPAAMNGVWEVASTPSSSTLTLRPVGGGSTISLTGTYVADSGIIRKVEASTLNSGPLILYGGSNTQHGCRLAATRKLGNLTNIVVSGSTATITTTCQPGLTAGTSRVQVRGASDSDLNGTYTVATTPTATTYTISVSNVTAGTYTDANLSVSNTAIDGTTWWNGVKGAASLAASNRPFPGTVAVADAPAGCSAAAQEYLVDPSNTTRRDYAISCIQMVEDIFPALAYAQSWATYRSTSIDYWRHHVINLMAAYSILKATGDLSSGEKAKFKQIMFSDRSDPGATQCTEYAWPSLAPGTITRSGSTVTGSDGSSFAGAAVGDYLGYMGSGETQMRFARIYAKASDTSVSVYALTGDFNPSSDSFRIFPAAIAGDCGMRYFLSMGVGEDAWHDHRLYPNANNAWDIAELATGRGNNQSYTSSTAMLSIDIGFADEDSAAAFDTSVQMALLHEFMGAALLRGPGDKSDTTYSLDRARWGNAILFNPGMMRCTNSAQMEKWGGYLARLEDDLNYQDIFLRLPDGSQDQMIPQYGSGTISWGISIASFWSGRMSGVPATSAAHKKYLLDTFYTNANSTSGGNPFTHSSFRWALMDRVDEIAASDFSTIPLNYAGRSDYTATACSDLGLSCAPSGYTGMQVLAQRSSHSSTSASVLTVNARSFEWPNDRQAAGAGNWSIYHQGTGDTYPYMCLTGGSSSGCAMEPIGNPIYAGNIVWFGSALPYSPGSHIAGMPNGGLVRWYSDREDKRFGHSNNSAFAAVTSNRAVQQWGGDLPDANTRYFSAFQYGGRRLILIYDYAKWTARPQVINTSFHLGGGSSGTRSWSSGLATVTNGDNKRLLSRFSGPRQLAFTLQSADTYSTRLDVCASSNGSSCNSSATEHEVLQTVLNADNTVSDVTVTELLSSSDWYGSKGVDATMELAAFFPRGDVMQESLPSTAITFANGIPAQVHVHGLAPGSTYSLRRDGSEIAAKTATAADNILVWEGTGDGSAHNWSVVLTGSISTPAFSTSSPLASGVVGSSLSRTISATGCPSTYAMTLESGSVPDGMSFADVGSGSATVSGTPSSPGTSVFVVRVTCDDTGTATREYSFAILPEGEAGLSLTLLQAGTSSAILRLSRAGLPRGSECNISNGDTELVSFASRYSSELVLLTGLTSPLQLTAACGSYSSSLLTVNLPAAASGSRAVSIQARHPSAASIRIEWSMDGVAQADGSGTCTGGRCLAWLSATRGSALAFIIRYLDSGGGQVASGGQHSFILP